MLKMHYNHRSQQQQAGMPIKFGAAQQRWDSAQTQNEFCGVFNWFHRNLTASRHRCSIDLAMRAAYAFFIRSARLAIPAPTQTHQGPTPLKLMSLIPLFRTPQNSPCWPPSMKSAVQPIPLAVDVERRSIRHKAPDQQRLRISTVDSDWLEATCWCTNDATAGQTGPKGPPYYKP